MSVCSDAVFVWIRVHLERALLIPAERTPQNVPACVLELVLEVDGLLYRDRLLRRLYHPVLLALQKRAVGPPILLLCGRPFRHQARSGNGWLQHAGCKLMLAPHTRLPKSQRVLRQMLHTLASSKDEDRIRVAEGILKHMAFQAVPMDQAQEWMGAVPWDRVLHFVLQHAATDSATRYADIIMAFLES